MAHPQQLAYFERIRDRFATAFSGAENILEVGSQNINGTVRDFFAAHLNYLGIDLGRAKDVDLVIPGELVELPDGWADIAISTECLEHAENWREILLNMIRIAKPQGLMLLTFAGKGRMTHGTLDSDVFSSPFTTTYYRNLGPDDIAKDIAIGKYFSRHGFEIDSIAHDTYFWGIRNNENPGDPNSDWETLESRLVRAQGQLGQAVNIYNELKLDLLKSQSACEQLRHELADVRAKLKISLEYADLADSTQANASLEAQQAKSIAAQALSQKDQARREAIELAQVLSEERKKAAVRLQVAEQAKSIAAQALSQKDQAAREAIELAQVLSEERKMAAFRLQVAEQDRLAMDQELGQVLAVLGKVRQQAASARQEAEIARHQSHVNWQIKTEIENSRIWRGTRFYRIIKDGLFRRLKSKLNTLPQSSPPGSDSTSHSVLQIESVPIRIESVSSQWLQDYFEQDWKCNYDLIRQSSEAALGLPSHGRKTVIIDWKCPEIDKDSGSNRMDAIIRIMLDLGVDISFFSEASNQDEFYVNRLRDLGISIYMGVDSAVKHLAAEGLSYEYVFLARPDTAELFLPFVQLYCPKAKLIYDTVDLHYLRLRRALRLYPEDSDVLINPLVAMSENYYAKEIIISRSSDKVVVVSDEEMMYLAKEDATLDIVTIPNIHVVAEHTPGFEERKDLLFIGGFDHQPNKDAMIYFCNEILPKIAETLTDISLTIVGSNMPDEIVALEGKHVKVLGYIEDLEPVLANSRIFVAPLRYGAGMKGKVGLSMAHGVPVVGTSIASEGFGFTDGKEMLITDSSSKLAEYTIGLYHNKELWSRLSMNGKIFIGNNYSPAVIKHRISSLFNPATYSQEEKTDD